MAKRRPSGDGMVRKREDGRWEGRIVIGHKENGDPIFRYIYADTQKALTAKLRQNITAYQGVDLTEECRMTLSEWLDRWLEQMVAILRPSTLEHYRSDMEHHVKPYLGQKKLTQITASDLRKLYDDLKKQGRVHPRPGQSRGLSTTTVHGIHTTLHHALKSAVDQRLLPHNPADHVEPPKVAHKSMTILNEEQMDSTAERLRNRKKYSYSVWIFPNPLRPEAPMNPTTAYHQLKKILAENDLPGLRFHDLRHTFATHALANGVDAKTLSGILGHTKASFTVDTYTHTTTDMHRKAAEIVGGFLTDYLGEEMAPWQNAEPAATAVST